MAVKILAQVNVHVMNPEGDAFYDIVIGGPDFKTSIQYGPVNPSTLVVLQLSAIIAAVKTECETNHGITFGPADKVHLLFPLEMFG